MATVELINLWNGAQGWLWPVLAAPFAGSFMGVLVTRLSRAGAGGETWRGILLGRSACPSCGHRLGAPDLAPVASFLALRGRCRFCGAPIARFHLWVELCATGIAAWAAASGEHGALLWAGCTLGWTLLTLGWIDMLCLRLPDGLTLPLILAGLAEAAWLEPEARLDRALGAAAGYAGFRALAWAYRLARGREGLGRGDAKLLAAGGAWVGVYLLGDVILGAALAALAWSVRRGRPDPKERLPFGPFLAASIWAVWLYA